MSLRNLSAVVAAALTLAACGGSQQNNNSNDASSGGASSGTASATSTASATTSTSSPQPSVTIATRTSTPTSSTSTATAQGPRDPARAEALFDEAHQAMNKGEIERACRLFEESNAADPAPGTLLNLGACYEKLGRKPQACAAFRRAEQVVTDPNRLSFVQAKLTALGC
ncbi:MAG: hypothetical protein U0271_12900 [Polyangiaceae bacterium]